jgi:anti-sigma factor RsiW
MAMNKKKNTDNANGPTEGELLLPWHVTGRLEASERESVDAYLASNPEVEFHLNLIREERMVIVEENEALSGAPAGALARLHQRIEEEDGAAIKAAEKRTLMDKLRGFLFPFEASSLRFAGIAAALIIVAQAAAIGVLVTSSGRIGPFETASLKTEKQTTQGTHLVLAFEEQSTAGEITKFLEEIGGDIVSGPTPDAMYIVKVSDMKLSGNDLDTLIKTLEARRTVVRLVAEIE